MRATRLHALAMLEGLGALDASTVQRALRDAAPEVRAAAVRVAEPWLAKAGDPLQAAVWRLAADRAPRVRWQLAVSLAAFPAADRVDHAAQLLASHGRDPFVVDGVVSSLTGLEHQALARLLARPGAPEDALGAARRRGGARRRRRPRSPISGRGSPMPAGRSPSAWRWRAAPSWRSAPRASACARRAG